MSNEESDERKSHNPCPCRREKEEDMKPWGILIFGLIGATATTFASLVKSGYFAYFLCRRRTTPYTDEEIKSAFRGKAKEFHPDQNQDRKEFAETNFKEVMVSYESIKTLGNNKKLERSCYSLFLSLVKPLA